MSKIKLVAIIVFLAVSLPLSLKIIRSRTIYQSSASGPKVAIILLNDSGVTSSELNLYLNATADVYGFYETTLTCKLDQLITTGLQISEQNDIDLSVYQRVIFLTPPLDCISNFHNFGILPVYSKFGDINVSISWLGTNDWLQNKPQFMVSLDHLIHPKNTLIPQKIIFSSGSYLIAPDQILKVQGKKGDLYLEYQSAFPDILILHSNPNSLPKILPLNTSIIDPTTNIYVTAVSQETNNTLKFKVMMR